MRRPKFRLALCAAGLAAALAGGALALGNGDSLISLSYLTDTFLPSAQSQLEEIQNDAMQEAYDQAAAQLQGGTGTSGLYSADFQSRTFSQGDRGAGPQRRGHRRDRRDHGALRDPADGGTPLPGGGGHLRRPGGALRRDVPGAPGELHLYRLRDPVPALCGRGTGGLV